MFRFHNETLDRNVEGFCTLFLHFKLMTLTDRVYVGNRFLHPGNNTIVIRKRYNYT